MRVVGLPGEQVEVRTNSFMINGSEVPEKDMPSVLRNKPWLTDRIVESSTQRRWMLGDDEVFVVGDNLAAANDSRFWGPLKVPDVIGVANKKAKGKKMILSLEPVLPVRATFVRADGPTTPLDPVT